MFHFKKFVGATKQGVRAELLEGPAQVPAVGLTSSVVGQHVRQLFSSYLFFHKSGLCCAIGHPWHFFKRAPEIYRNQLAVMSSSKVIRYRSFFFCLGP